MTQLLTKTFLLPKYSHKLWIGRSFHTTSICAISRRIEELKTLKRSLFVRRENSPLQRLFKPNQDLPKVNDVDTWAKMCGIDQNGSINKKKS